MGLLGLGDFNGAKKYLKLKILDTPYFNTVKIATEFFGNSFIVVTSFSVEISSS